MIENEFILQDRIQKIKSINELYDLENNSYLSFSGGKDSTILHYILDEALPNNKIPRVYINTGIEYKDIYIREKSCGKRQKICNLLFWGKYKRNVNKGRLSFQK